MVYPALLQLMRTPRLPVVDWTDAHADLNRLVRFAERRNMISARVPSHFKRSLPQLTDWPSTLKLHIQTADCCDLPVRMTTNLSLSLSTKLRKAEIVSWSDKNSFDLDIMGRIPYLWGSHEEKVYFSCQKHILVSASVTLHWLPFVKCLVYIKPKVTFMHCSNRVERKRQK
jgi:hypothetical protein